MLEYRKIDLKIDTYELILLSKLWYEENCSYGMVVNTIDDLKDDGYVCLDNNKIIGYIFGHYYIEEKKRSCIEIGSKCFDIDEVYVLNEYRNRGVGEKLFNLLEEDVKDKIDYLTLATSTKDYNKILHFYCDNNQMVFHSAFLFKKENK